MKRLFLAALWTLAFLVTAAHLMGQQAATNPDPSAGVTVKAENQPDESAMKVFTLQNARAVAAERIVNQLFARDIHSVAADERTNSLIVRGPAAELNVIHQLLTRLDDQSESASAAKTTGPARWPPTLTPSIAELTKRYEAKDKQASDLTRQIRELQSSKWSDKPRLDKLNADLRRVVSEAFAARHELHRAEADELANRVMRIRASLETRSALSDQIIDRRVKDLLNPDLQWDNTTSASPLRGPASREAGVTRSITPTGEDLTAARAYRDKLLERWQQIEALYRAGRFPLDELLRAAKELGEAELAAATTPDERIAARQQLVERLKSVKSIVDPKFENNVEPEHWKLAVDAEVLKAEAQLNAEKPPGGNPDKANVWPSQSGSRTESATSSAPDQIALRAYRDKLRERVKAVEDTYKAGRVTHVEWLRALVELDQAEIASATNADDRQAASRKKIEHLKEIKSSVEQHYKSGTATQPELLLAEAELLKAESELAAKASIEPSK